MVYKKYIKKDGKLYGPYIYESKRIDGKVVSQYHGSNNSFNIKKYAWIFVSIAIAGFLAYIFFTANLTGLTGFATLSTEVNHTLMKQLRGTLFFRLNRES